MNKKNKSNCIFQQPHFIVCIVNNSIKITLALIFMLVIVYLFNQENIRFIAIPISCTLLCISCIALVFIMRKFAHKIEINFSSKTINISMFRADHEEIISFSDLKDIRIEKFGYIILGINGNTVYYNDAGNKELISCLNQAIITNT
ncbi:hypothetical protein [Desulfogranum marinum]|uniref:hypothetical protein n=1 Tax=Desulfogranum marinum TaxID=453220 RepID=UPI0029C7467A|nr:hypothetical protein [Desulfogranum marinum]